VSRSALAVQEVVTSRSSRLLPPIDEELSFDFELEPQQPAPRAIAPFQTEGAGVKAAILRWLEEQA
jgi:hypothetical protein